MSTIAGSLGILTLSASLFALATGDRLMAVDCLVVAGLSLAVWAVTRRRIVPPAESAPDCAEPATGPDRDVT